MVEKTLIMGFENELGKKFNLRVRAIKDELTPSEVGTVMDTIIAKDVFLSTGGKLVKKLEAEIVTEQTTPLELA